MKLPEYILCTKKDIIQQFLLLPVSLRYVFTRVPWHMHVVLLMEEPAFWRRIQMRCTLFASRGMHTHVLWYSRECAQTLIRKRRNCWIKLDWTTDVTWTILTMSLIPFWCLNVVVPSLYMQGQKVLGFHQKYLCINVCLCCDFSFQRYCCDVDADILL